MTPLVPISHLHSAFYSSVQRHLRVFTAAFIRLYRATFQRRLRRPAVLPMTPRDCHILGQ